MINLLFDIETDGLDATVCHSLVIIDVNSGVKISCADNQQGYMPIDEGLHMLSQACLLYTSDAADDSLRVDLGGRRIIKKSIR